MESLFYFISILLFTLADSSRNYNDLVERIRKSNIRGVSQYLALEYKRAPYHSVAVSATLNNYGGGAIADYSSCECESKKISNIAGFDNINQLKEILPAITKDFFGYDDALSSWNGLFVADAHAIFEREFIDTLFGYFNINVRNMDFKKGNLTSTSIREWMKASVLGKSSDGDLISPRQVKNDERFMYLLTHYFSGSLGCYVDHCETKLRHFTTASGNKVKKPFMRIQGKHKYASVYIDKTMVEIIQIPFEGNTFYLNIIIPKYANNTLEVLRVLEDPTRYDELFSHLEDRDIVLYMPYININRNYNHLAALEKIYPDLDFSSMRYEGIFRNSREAYISEMLINLHIQVNEGNPMPTECKESRSNSGAEPGLYIKIDCRAIYQFCTSSGIPMTAAIFSPDENE